MQATMAPPDRSLAGKYLTFWLNGEQYGLGILKVREILGVLSVTAVPRTPPYLRGVVNLRGQVIPVVDLRLKLGLPPVEDSAQTCIIVVEVTVGAACIPMGLLVDQVSDVRDIPAEDIEAPPRFAGQDETAYILGLGKQADHVVLLLDADETLAGAQRAPEPWTAAAA